MKMFIASMLMITSLSVFAKVEVQNLQDRKEFEQYIIQSDKAGKFTVSVDEEVLRVDCHGLSTAYFRSDLSTGEILIDKQNVLHTMNMCPPAVDHVATSGIHFTVEFKQSYGGTKIILVPVNAKVLVK